MLLSFIIIYYALSVHTPVCIGGRPLDRRTQPLDILQPTTQPSVALRWKFVRALGRVERYHRVRSANVLQQYTLLLYTRICSETSMYYEVSQAREKYYFYRELR